MIEENTTVAGNRLSAAVRRISLLFGAILLSLAIQLIQPAYAQQTLESQSQLLSEKLWKQSLLFEVWNFSSPSIAAHFFVGCGRRCRIGGVDDEIVQNWIKFSIDKDALSQLHRGQFLSTLSELGLKPEQTIIFSDLDVIRFGTMLTDLAIDFPPKTHFGIVEPVFGYEYGWMLSAICKNHVFLKKQLPEFSLAKILRSILDAGINTNLESGVHEFEGLSHCAQLPTTDARLGAIKKQINQIIKNRILDTLKEISPDGQLYSSNVQKMNALSVGGWPSCSEPKVLCINLQNLVKQAHFFDWSIGKFALTGDPGVTLAWKRFNELMKKVAESVTSENIKRTDKNWFLYVGAVAHAVRAAEKLVK